MKATLRSVRIAPKKANIIARMVRGMPVRDAAEALKRTNKKAARIVEKLLASAVANATHNDKQDAAELIISSIVVNQGTAYRRGMPKARGQTRPYRKFLSHIEIVLGYPTDGEMSTIPKMPKSPKKAEKKQEKASQAPQKAVKTPGSAKTKKNTSSSESSASPGSSVSSQ